MRMIIMKRMLMGIITAGLLYNTALPTVSAADTDLDEQIHNQQLVLQELTSKKAQQSNQVVLSRMDSLEQRLNDLNARPAYDAQGAIDALAAQLNELREAVAAATTAQTKILEMLNTQAQAKSNDEDYRGTAATNRFLVNPGAGDTVSYTQDAINSQGNSTMVFQYSPNQLYKIYCRRGYLTDLAFKKGEKINYVGGGDTAGWAVSNTEVDGVPHLYIKPVVEASTTNLIVTTDKHSYQIILNTSDWYNPMVRWLYDAETRNANLIEQQKDDRVTTGKLKVTNVDNLDFGYEISGNGENKPSMVFSDGERTYIKFDHISRQQLPLFVRQRGKKEMALVNYTIKDNYYVVEKVFDVAQFKGADSDTITIKHKK